MKARGALDAQEAAALREAEQLVLWRRYGCTSLVDYMEREMGYTPRAAIERLRVVKAIVDLPHIAPALEQGELSYSGARELTRVATPETEAEWLAAVGDKNLREIEECVSGHERGDRPGDPVDPRLRTQIVRFEVKAETHALMRQALSSLGFKRHEVTVAIERARTHVGTPSLPVEQWIRIALTYTPSAIVKDRSA